MSYRLIENVYEADNDGVLRLTERMPVNPDGFEVVGDRVRLLYPSGGTLDITLLMSTDPPKFTLTEDLMHDDCAPCQAGLPEETHAAPDTMLKTAAKTILMVLAVATVAAFMQWCK